MMTKLAILTKNEIHRFDSPPSFNADERSLYFSLKNDDMKIIQELRTPKNKVGFLLQLGYFKANGKFFTSDQFRKKDTEYVINMLGLEQDKIDLSSYQKKIPTDHRKRILTLLSWQPFNKIQEEAIVTHTLWLIQKQFSQKNVFLSIIDFCWQNKIELPSYNALAIIITNAYNKFEYGLLNLLDDELTNAHREKLNKILGTMNEENKKPLQRAEITLLKQINQSLRPSDINENVEVFKKFKEYFHDLKSILDKLSLSDQATEYFATWVQKSTAFQLNQFPNKNKLYLYLLCYIKHQFYFRHDILTTIFLKSVRAAINAANNKLSKIEKENRPERNKAIKKLSETNKNSRELIEKITEILNSTLLTEAGKLSQIKALVDKYNSQNDSLEKTKMIKLEESLDNISKNHTFFDALEAMSIALQRKVSSIVNVIEFNIDTSKSTLIDAINNFKLFNGEINNNPPQDFLNSIEKTIIYKKEKLRVSLYKILLFVHMADSIKSGDLNLRFSYHYKAIHEYLIDEKFWRLNKKTLLNNAGLQKYDNFTTTIDNLKLKLDDKYQTVNDKFLNGENKYLSIDKNGKVKVSTPKIDSDKREYNSLLLSQSGFVPIIKVLSDINQVANFSSSFKHFSIKYKKMKPEAKIILAGILGKGCNIGVNKIANISVGVSENTLKNTVNWFFSLKNIQQANNKIIAVINKLFLANGYRNENNQLHTGSDGRKVNVAVDSLHANYSFKYFGKDKGVSIYTFLDERQLLFHLTVISSSEREAAYVIDGLLQNDVIKSNVHSTDTHGFTETIFAATHFIETAFAPRLKNIGRQKIYSFSTKQAYEKRGYKILPSRTINLKLIENNWDDILRFMVTIKLKHTTASQLLKRLSSYAKDHPLYKALKEFGRIIKSIFILTYLDDVKLRQRIEKQLNKGELSNKFSKAVFFSNNQEFKEATKEEQEITATCKMLIQNAIVLWNYLYLSQLLINNSSLEERTRMIESIQRGSVIVWQHINLQGEYDFTKIAANDGYFDTEKIMALG